jgi:hypothetical protein
MGTHTQSANWSESRGVAPGGLPIPAKQTNLSCAADEPRGWLIVLTGLTIPCLAAALVLDAGLGAAEAPLKPQPMFWPRPVLQPRPPVALPGLPVQYVYDDYWYMYLKKISLDGSVSTTSHLMRLDMALPPCVSLSSCIHPSPIRPFWENRDFP